MMKLMSCMGLALVVLTSSLLLNVRPMNQSTSLAATGKLSGLILDPGEARVPGARIIIEGKGFRRELTSANDGSYAIELPEGKYKVKVECDGFYPSRKKTIRISSNAPSKIDVTLKGIRNDESHPRRVLFTKWAALKLLLERHSTCLTKILIRSYKIRVSNPRIEI